MGHSPSLKEFVLYVAALKEASRLKSLELGGLFYAKDIVKERHVLILLYFLFHK